MEMNGMEVSWMSCWWQNFERASRMCAFVVLEEQDMDIGKREGLMKQDEDLGQMEGLVDQDEDLRQMVGLMDQKNQVYNQGHGNMGFLEQKGVLGYLVHEALILCLCSSYFGTFIYQWDMYFL